MGDFDVKTLIYEVKNGKTDSFLKLVEVFAPVIKKYVHLMYKDESEDINSELILALLEAVYKISYCNYEAQCIKFLSYAIKIRFYELYRQSRIRYDHECYLENLHILDNNKVDLDNLIIQIHFSSLISSKHSNLKKITYLILMELKTDSEISKEMGISRQYINKIRRMLKKELENIFY